MQNPFENSLALAAAMNINTKRNSLLDLMMPKKSFEKFGSLTGLDRLYGEIPKPGTLSYAIWENTQKQRLSPEKGSLVDMFMVFSERNRVKEKGLLDLFDVGSHIDRRKDSLIDMFTVFSERNRFKEKGLLDLFDVVDRIDRNKNSLLDFVQGYNNTNDLTSKAVFHSLDSILSTKVFESIKEENYAEVKVIDEVFEEIANSISTNPEVIQNEDTLNTFIKALNNRIDAFCRREGIKLTVNILDPIIIIFSLYCGYLQITSNNPLSVKQTTDIVKSSEKNTERKIITAEKNTEKNIITSEKRISKKITISEESVIKAIEANNKAICTYESSMHSEPSNDSSIVCTIKKEQEVTVISKRVKWMSIAFETDNGKVTCGWVRIENFK